MSSDTATKNVILSLKVVADPGNEAILDAMNKSVADAMQRQTDAHNEAMAKIGTAKGAGGSSNLLGSSTSTSEAKSQLEEIFGIELDLSGKTAKVVEENNDKKSKSSQRSAAEVRNTWSKTTAEILDDWKRINDEVINTGKQMADLINRSRDAGGKIDPHKAAENISKEPGFDDLSDQERLMMIQKVSEGAAKAYEAEEAAAAKAASAEEREYDRITSAAQRTWSKIMRERQRAADDAKRLAEKQASDEERAYDKQAAEALAAYSRIMRSKEAEAKQTEALTQKYNNQAYAADNMGRAATRQGAAALGALTGIAEGIAKVGILGEESTEELLRGLVKVSGGFQFIREGIALYTDLSQMIAASTRATYLQAQAQATLNAAEEAGIVLTNKKTAAIAAQVAVEKGFHVTGMDNTGFETTKFFATKSAQEAQEAMRNQGFFPLATKAGTNPVAGAAAQAGAGVATGAAGTAGAAGAGGEAGGVATGGVGLAGAAGTAGFLALAAAGGLALNELGTAIARMMGSTSSASESFTGSMFGLVKALQEAEKAAQKTADMEAFRAAKQKGNAEFEERAATRRSAANEAQGIRRQFQQLQTAAESGGEFADQPGIIAARRNFENQMKEVELAQKRQAEEQAKQDAFRKQPPVVMPKREKERSFAGAVLDSYVPFLNGGFNFGADGGPTRENSFARRMGFEQDAKTIGGDKQFANLGLADNSQSLEAANKKSSEEMLKAAQDAQKLADAHKQAAAAAKATTESIRQQAVAAAQAQKAAENNLRGIKAGVGKMFDGEAKMVADLVRRAKAGEKLNEGELQLAEQHGAGGIKAIRDQRIASTEGNEDKKFLASELEKDSDTGESRLENANRDEDHANDRLVHAQSQQSTEESAAREAMKAFQEQLSKLPAAMQKVIDDLNKKAGTTEKLDLSEVGAAGDKVAGVAKELSDTIVAELGKVEEEFSEAIRQIRSRQARGSLSQATA